MEYPTIAGRPRLLSDIREIELEVFELQSEAGDSLSAGEEEHYSAVESPQAEARAQADHDLPYNPSPRRPPPTAFNNPSSRMHYHVQQLIPLYSPPAMDNSPASASAPASLRAEHSDIQTPSPSPPSDRSQAASPTPSSSTTDVRLPLPIVDPRSLSSSPVDPRSLSSSPADDRGRELHRTGPRPPVQTGTMNLKLLTCHWWFQTGNCRFSARDCLYAHHDTGKHAEAPRQIVPGQPAVAGRNADRRLRQADLENNLAKLSLNPNPNLNIKVHSSSSSLADMTNNVFNSSTPTTPGMMLHTPHVHNTHNMPGIPIIPNSPLHYATTNAAQLENEVRFFRTLVEQGGKEKEVMVTTIESLQAENQALHTTNTTLTSENTRLTQERDVLRGALALLQQQQTPLSRSSTPISTLRRGMPGSASWADFGAIGGKRLGS